VYNNKAFVNKQGLRRNFWGQKKKELLINSVVMVTLIMIGFIILIPFFWMVSASLKSPEDVFSYPVKWIPDEWMFSNYPNLFKLIDFSNYILNSLVVAVCGTIAILFTSSFAAYAFSKMTFKGRKTFFSLYIITISIPWQAYVVPQFIIMKYLKLYNTHLGLIILLCAAVSAFSVFMVRQFYTSIPDELCEASRIDGLNDYGIYLRIMLPLSKPVISTLAIFTFVVCWNDYMGSLIYITDSEKRLIQLALRQFIAVYNQDYSLVMAGCVISLIPIVILFLFLQRNLIAGIATTGLKG